MSSTYVGDDTNFPEEITIPSDGQGAIKAADVNPAFEGLADAIAYIRARLRPKHLLIVDGASWVAPAGCYEVMADGCGGGGGGRPGGSGIGVTNNCGASGPSGAAARRDCRIIPVVPGTTYTITIGVGGAGAAINGAPGDGDNTVFTDGDTVNEIWRGGAGGPPGTGSNTAGQTVYVPGATFPAGTPAPGYQLTTKPQGGGYGVASTVAAAAGGNGASGTFIGGVGGTGGAQHGSHYGGPGGGGGEGGPFGPGGDGGAGGDSNNAGDGVAGSPGSDAPDNSGAGGGGGGAGGCASGTPGAGSAGGAGGSGRLLLSWFGLDEAT